MKSYTITYIYGQYYQPQTIEVDKNEPFRLTILLKDGSDLLSFQSTDKLYFENVNNTDDKIFPDKFTNVTKCEPVFNKLSLNTTKEYIFKATPKSKSVIYQPQTIKGLTIKVKTNSNPSTIIDETPKVSQITIGSTTLNETQLQSLLALLPTSSNAEQ